MIKDFFNNTKKYIPNILTTLRLGVVPIFWYQFLSGNMIFSTLLFAGACITDAVDGHLARKWNVESKYGKTIDPLADKSLVISSLILYMTKYNLLMIIPLVLESCIAVVNIVHYIKNIDFTKIKKSKFKDKLNYIIENGKVEVNEIGRKKTIALMLMASISILNTNFNFLLEPLINTLIFGTATLELVTLHKYTKSKLIKGKIKIEQNEKFYEELLSNEENNKTYEKTKNNNKLEIYKKLNEELKFLNKNNSFNIKKNLTNKRK